MGRSSGGAYAPFERIDNNPTPSMYLKMVLGGLTIVPLKAVLILMLLIVFTGTLRLALALSIPKKWVLVYTSYTARVILAVLGFWVIEEVNKGVVNDRNRPVLVVSNHVSYLEILYFMSTGLCPSFVMKQTCVEVPFIGSIALNLGALCVDRKDNGKGTAETLVTRIRELEEENKTRQVQPLLIFPEGTTTNGTCLIRFRTGAFLAGTSVLPVLVQFPFDPNTGFSCAFESISTPQHIFRTLCGLKHAMKVTYLERYDPSKTEKEDPSVFAKNVQNLMAKKLGVPVCDQTYSDKLEYHQSLRTHYEKLGKYSLYLYVRPDKVKSQ